MHLYIWEHFWRFKCSGYIKTFNFDFFYISHEMQRNLILIRYVNHVWNKLKVILVLLSKTIVVLHTRYQKWLQRFYFSTFHGQWRSAFPNFICTRNLTWHIVTSYQQRSDYVTVHGSGTVRVGLFYVPLFLKSESFLSSFVRQESSCQNHVIMECVTLNYSKIFWICILHVLV